MKRLLVAFFIFLTGTTVPAHADTYDAYEAGDYEKAKSILLPLAEAGNANAMNHIGLMHDYGKGFPKDEKLACDWYEKAALANDSYGQYNFSICYEIGLGGRIADIDKTIYWAEKAADQGNIDAQISLIDTLSQKDRKRAAYWGQKAVDQGSALARAAMWSKDLPHKGKQASPADIACVLVMNFLLDKDWSYCD